MRSIRFFVAVVAVVLFGVASRPVLAVPHLINESARQWVQAAETGRADILILGDSTVGYDAWMKGIEWGSFETVGLAGTGVIPAAAARVQSWGYQTAGVPVRENWSNDPMDVPVDRQNYVWQQKPLTAGATPADTVGIKVPGPGVTLDPREAYDYHLWTASSPGGGSVSAVRTLNWSLTQRLPPVATQTPASGLQHTVFSFDAQPDQAPGFHRFYLDDTSDTSVIYWRLLRPQATGTTMSAWWWSGHSTDEFLNGKYFGSGTDQQGRVAVLGNIVDGGSGKLHVMIYEGLNDRWRGHSPETFRGNVEDLINAVRTDWSAAGRSPIDLSFSAYGMYEPQPTDDPADQEIMREYAQQLHDLAVVDPQVSFIDIREYGPSFEEATRLGYMLDNVHLSPAGSLFWGEKIMRTLTGMPQPQVTGRYVFYNDSSFDGQTPAADGQDDLAIASDKLPLMPGKTASFDNYTSYAKGINGVMIDVVDLAGTPTLDDFEFKVGNDDNPDGWSQAPAPIGISVRLGEGANGADRITILWEDNAIDKQWLQIIVEKLGESDLDEEDVFYFGNSIGESGNSPIDAKVNAYDMLAARDNVHGLLDPALIDDPVDFDRNQRVDAIDVLIARGNNTSFLNALQLITVPGTRAASVVPEPGTGVMLLAGALGLLVLACPKRRR